MKFPKATCLIKASFIIFWLTAGTAPAFSETLNDPTRPPDSIIKLLPGAVSEQDVVPTLSAVKVDGKRSFAIINGKVIRLGDKLDNYTLVAVDSKQAVLLSKGNKLRLSIDVVDYKKTVMKPAKKQRF